MRAHFRETFATRGTLMFSVMNMIEMAQNSGPSYERVRDLLNDAGSCWLRPILILRPLTNENGVASWRPPLSCRRSS